MRYSDEYLREFLPPENPPSDMVPGDVLSEVASWLDRGAAAEGKEPSDRHLVARATRWTYAVFSELDLGQFFFRPNFSPDWLWPFGAKRWVPAETLSFGLFDESAKRGLGIIVDLPSWPGPSFAVVGYVSFPRLGNVRFPVAVRRSNIELHLLHPQAGTAACWAQCNQSQQWGFVTAGHVVSSSRPGGSIPLLGGGSGSLMRSCYQPVDAAFVQTPQPAVLPSKLPVLSFPAVGLAVDILCQSGPQQRTVVQVNNNMGVLHTAAVGVYFYLDQPATPGDSGALVQAATGDGVGIYAGQMTTPGPPTGLCGLAQNFDQAVYALNITPYR